MKLTNGSLSRFFISSSIKPMLSATRRVFFLRGISTSTFGVDMEEFTNYLNNLKNFEKLGVPKGAGTDSEDGFDLGRMRRLMELLGNPQSKFKAVHIAGSKGKGSTAAFLSNILRVEGYSVGCYTSPHIQSIRERISVGKSGDPVSAESLNNHFQSVKNILDHAVELENGHLSHFEVFTGIAFSLFAQENVDIAIIEAGLGGARDATNVISNSDLAASIITTVGEEHLEALGGSLESIARAKSGIIKHRRPVVLGGPFLPYIEQILRDKASSMSSPILSVSDPGNKSEVKDLSESDGKPCQSCDIVLQTEKELQLSLELYDVKLLMLGSHQLRNAATATCTSLALRNQGWKISDESIRTGLERTYLLGRSQFLTNKETEVLGFPSATILLDGAHTEESAKALADTIRMAFPKRKIVLVVAMANDKDHLGFAKELLSLGNLEAVFPTEVEIAGSKSRMTSSIILKEIWNKASKETERQIAITTEPSLLTSIRSANEFLKKKKLGTIRVLS